MSLMGTYIPEGFVHRPVPTDKGAGGKKQNPENGQAQPHSIIGIHTEISQAGYEVNEQRAGGNFKKREKDEKKWLGTKKERSTIYKSIKRWLYRASTTEN